MKLLVFAIFLLTTAYQAVEYRHFRFKDGSLSIKGKGTFNISGRILHADIGSLKAVTMFGMDMGTMTSFQISTRLYPDTADGFNEVYSCYLVQWSDYDAMVASGSTLFSGSWSQAEFSGKCNAGDDQDWTFKTSNKGADKWYYSPEEAGRRAKNLIGKRKWDYAEKEVISYAIQDDPYRYNSCHGLEGILLNAAGPGPGVVIISTDGEKCAILDNEGDKFIHISPRTDLVTIDSIAMLKVYFPNGYRFKRIPNE